MATDPKRWLDLLVPRMQARWRAVEKFEQYYDGNHPLAFATSKYREQFAAMLHTLNDNWMALVVDAVEERLHVEGFRFGTDTAGDRDAWTIWQRNELDADSELAHSTAITTGVCPVMVWADGDGLAQITVEHPSQVFVAYEPGSRRRRVAAVKVWIDEWSNKTFANLYLPDSITKWSGPAPSAGSFLGQWTERSATLPNPLGVVPIVELVNRPKLLGTGRSEIAEVLSTQDQINKLVCDMMVAAEFSAFKQRWATGIEMPLDPETGEEVENLKAAQDRLWHTANETAKFGEFGQTDLGIYVKAIENRVQSLASRTRTPPHYLLGQAGSFPSGESLKATETGLIAKVRSRQRHFGERWEEIERLAFAVEGSTRDDTVTAETIWDDPESRTESEHIDSLVKKLALGVPLPQLWEDAGYTPTQIERFRSMLVEYAAIQALATVTTAVPQDVPPLVHVGG